MLRPNHQAQAAGLWPEGRSRSSAQHGRSATCRWTVNVTCACETRLVGTFDARLARYRAQLDGAGLGRWADALCLAVRPSIRLVADARIDTTVPGVSRLGGSADLPLDVPWPADDDGTPLSFITQLDLRQMAAYDVEGILPRTGLLSFFYAAASQRAWGFDPVDHGAWAVIHTSDIATKDEAGMMWGDLGRLYYWIRHEDLIAGHWDCTWLILQCG